MFSVAISPDFYSDARDWCEKEFGSEHIDFATWRGLGNNEIGGDFYFEHEEDASSFERIVIQMKWKLIKY